MNRSISEPSLSAATYYATYGDHQTWTVPWLKWPQVADTNYNMATEDVCAPDVSIQNTALPYKKYEICPQFVVASGHHYAVVATGDTKLCHLAITVLPIFKQLPFF